MFLLQRLFCLILKYLFNFKKKKKRNQHCILIGRTDAEAEPPVPWLPDSNMCWIIKKAREFQKNIYFCFIV